MKIAHTKTKVIQYNEYYAHGSPTANSWTRESNTGNNFLANSGTELNKVTALYDLDYRHFDPILGRINGVDPMADKYSSLTPYNYSFNAPTMHTDASGADPDFEQNYWVEESMQRRAANKGPINDLGDMSGNPLSYNYANTLQNIRSIGGWTARGPLMSVGGMTVDQFHEMSEDFEKLSPQEFGFKWGEITYTFEDKGIWVKGSSFTTGGNLNSNALGSIESDFTIHSTKDLWISNWVVKVHIRKGNPQSNLKSGARGSDEPGLFDKFWNSRIMRMLVPDNITLDVNYTAVLGRGGSLTYTINLLTRGKSPGIYVTKTSMNPYLAEIGWGINFGINHYLRDINTMLPSSLLGKAGTVSIGAGPGVNYNTGYESDDSDLLDPIWNGFSAGFGETVGASAGVGNTSPIGIIVPINGISLSFIFIPYAR